VKIPLVRCRLLAISIYCPCPGKVVGAAPDVEGGMPGAGGTAGGMGAAEETWPSLEARADARLMSPITMMMTG